MNALRLFRLISVFSLILASIGMPNNVQAQTFDCSSVTEIPQSECDALAALYNSTNGADWTRSDNWLQTATPCSWYGVSCVYGATTNVNNIGIGFNNLTGSIPSEIGNFPFLENLFLGGNPITGPIPPQISQLTNLRFLNLGSNQHTGSIPVELTTLTQLEHLNLSFNQLSGTIPLELGDMTTLTWLSLASNQFTGAFPVQLTNLTNLQNLNISSANLSGPVPDEIGQLTSLTLLDLSNNDFSGLIPAAIGNLTSLEQLWLNHNNLSGEVPFAMTNLTSLNLLDISCNQLISTDPEVQAFLDTKAPGWQTDQCFAQHIVARLTLNQVDATGWPAGTLLTLTIEDPLTGLSPDHTDTAISQLDDPTDPDSGTSVNFNFDQVYTLKSGDVVTVAGDGIARTTIVADIHVLDVDIENNIVSGTAGEGITSVNVRLWSSNPVEMQRDAAVIDGVWSANFSIPTEEFGSYNIEPGDDGVVRWFEGDGDFTTDYWIVPNSTFGARPETDTVEGWEWPAGSNIDVYIDDPATLQNPDHSATGYSDWVPGDPGHTLFTIELVGYDLKVNDLVTVTDGTTTHEHTVRNLALGEVDLDADTVSGTADPGELVNPYVCGNNGCAFREETTDQNGNWIANFSVPGDRDFEQDILDIRPGAWVDSTINDEDGDVTQAGRQLPNPNFDVRPNVEQVEAFQWAIGDHLVVEIDNPTTPNNPDYIVSGDVTGVADWDPSQTYLVFELGDVYDVQVGDVVSMSNGSITKTTTVTNLGITDVDVDADVVQGVAEPNQDFSVWTCYDGPCVNRDETADSSGNWSVNFAQPGDQPWEQDTADIRPGSWIDSAVGDEDGDRTMYGWSVPYPTFSVRANFDQVETWEWTAGDTLTISIDGSDADSDPDYTTTGVVPSDPSDPRHYLPLELAGLYDILPGDTVTVSNGSFTKTTVVTNLEFTNVDIATDVVDGIAEPDQALSIWTCYNGPCVSRDVTADATGHWSANFGIPGDQPWEQDTMDLQPGSWIDSSVTDEDGDQTMFGWSIPNPTITVRLTENEVHANDWTLDNLITLEIDDPSTPESIDYTDSQPATPADWNPGHTWTPFVLDDFALAPGFVVTMYDNSVTKTHRITGHTVTYLDIEAETVEGTAEPNAEVWVDVWDTGVTRRVSADSSGHWLADFSVAGDEDWEIDTADLQFGTQGEARVHDENGDSTAITWMIDWVAPPSIPLVFAISNPVDLTVPVATLESVSVLNMLNDALFRLDADGNLLPLAATGQPVTDGLVYTVTLRPDGKWSNGDPVTAQHYVDGILRVLDPNLGSDYGFVLYPILNAKEFHDGETDRSQVGIRAVNDTTLEFTLAESTAHFEQILASPVILPVRQDLIDLYGDAWTLPEYYLSNGMYTLVEIDAGHIVVEKNIDYNGPIQPVFSQIAFDVIAEPDQQAAAYKNGDVDVLLSTPLDTIMNDAVLRENLTVLPSPGVQYVGFLTQVGPTSDPLVRKALASAIDRQVILDDVLQTPWRVEATGVIPPELAGYQGSSVGYSYNPSQAQSYLAQAGYPGGAGFPVLTFLVNENQHAIMQEIASQWESVLGITVNIHVGSVQARNQVLTECRDTPAECTYNGFALGWFVDYPDPYNILNDMFAPDGVYNYTQWDNAQYRALVDQGASEQNPVQRISYLQQAERILVQDDAAIAPLFHTDYALVVRPGIFPYYSSTFFSNLAYWSNVDPAGDGMSAAVIGAEGGAVSSDNDTVSADVPAGALEEDVTLSVTDLGGNYQITVTQEELNVISGFSVQPHGLQFAVPVTLTFGWNDSNGDGLVDGTSIQESDLVLIKDGAAITPACSVNINCDTSANQITVQVSSLSVFELAASVDTTAPTITWIGNIHDGDTFYFGSVPPEPICTATDDLSGVDGGCTVTGYSSSEGLHTLVATARDQAGNMATETRHYAVLGWTLQGFYQPVDMNGVYNLVKGGSTVPLKFEIFAGPTELVDTTTVKSLTYAQTSCNANAITDELELVTVGNTVLRYDAASGQFIYNWKTPKMPGTCFRITVTTIDDSALVAYFKLK